MPIQIADAYRYSLFAQQQTGLLFNLPAPDPDHGEQLPEGISLCMIVKNEERFLAECLESVKDVVDEICIVDTGSTDRTVEIARSYGAKIEFRDWRSDFAWARNEALAMATKRWTLVLDGDEELVRESVPLVRSLRTTPAGLAAVYINIVNNIDDSAGAGTMSHRLVRIFPTNPLLRYTGRIHEALTLPSGREFFAVLTPITILHKGYTVELLASKEKDARNRPLLEKAFQENGDDLFSMFNFGNSEILCGNVEHGIEVLEKMLATAESPKLYFPIAYLMLAQTFYETLRDNDRALAKINEGIARFPNDAGIVFTKGQILVKMGRLDEARTLLQETLDLRESMRRTVMTDEEIFEWKIFYVLAGTYEQEHDYATAIDYIDKALANKPQSLHMSRTKALFLERSERFFEAEQLFRSMADLDPHQGRVEFVNFLLRRKRFAHVLAIVESEADIGLNADAVAQLNVSAAQALIETKAGDPLPFLEAALRHAPGDGLALRHMEATLLARGDYAAVEALRARELSAPCVRSSDFGRRAYRLLAENRNDEARYAAEQGLLLDPAGAELRFNLGLALMRLGDEERAIEEFGRIGPSVPEVHAKAHQLRAGLLLKHDDVPSAVEAVEDSFSSGFVTADAVVRCARALVGAGATAAGRALLERYVDVDRSVALELAGVLLAAGDVAAAGRIADASLA